MQILGSRQLMEQVRNKDLCTVCGACVGLCPYHQAHKGKIALTFDCDLEQGQCYAYCPKTETDNDSLSREMFGIEYQESPIGHHLSIGAARAGKKITGNRFQNGGTVTALIISALENGFIDSALLTGRRGILPEPELVEKSSDVARFATTKYMATPSLYLLNKAATMGRKKMGVVGTGCQAKAVAKMKMNPLQKDDFREAIALSLGLFCTWSLDTRRFVDYLTKTLKLAEVTAMDVPPPPAEIMVVKTETGEVPIPLADIRPMIQKGCSLCSDMTAEWADVSVGALEGNPGWNTIIIRSERGKRWVESAVDTGALEMDELPGENLEHLITAVENKRERVRNLLNKEET